MIQVVAFMKAYNQRKKLNPSLKLAAGASGSRSVVKLRLGFQEATHIVARMQSPSVHSVKEFGRELWNTVPPSGKAPALARCQQEEEYCAAKPVNSSDICPGHLRRRQPRPPFKPGSIPCGHCPCCMRSRGQRQRRAQQHEGSKTMGTRKVPAHVRNQDHVAGNRRDAQCPAQEVCLQCKRTTTRERLGSHWPEDQQDRGTRKEGRSEACRPQSEPPRRLAHQSPESQEPREDQSGPKVCHRLYPAPLCLPLEHHLGITQSRFTLVYSQIQGDSAARTHADSITSPPPRRMQTRKSLAGRVVGKRGSVSW